MSTSLNDILAGKICPYCNCETRLVKGDAIYTQRANDPRPPAYLSRNHYQCVNNPDHYVGTYTNSKKYFGRIADAELRIWKRRGHEIFEPLWKDLKYFKSSQQAYRWLSNLMELPKKHTHFGMFTIEQCKQAIDIIEGFKREKDNNQSNVFLDQFARL